MTASSRHRVPNGSRAFANIQAKAELASMLPGLRFLFAAIILTMSVLVFGLGAAALLRAAHEEVASNPSRRAPPETVFAQPNETALPVLAMLRVDPPATEPKASEKLTSPVEPAAIAAPLAEPERVAALKPDEPSLPVIAKNDPTVTESPASGDVAQAAAEAPAAADEVKIAATTAPAASEMAPAPSEQAPVQASPEADLAASKIATLGGPPVAIEPSAQTARAGVNVDRRVIRKRTEARRAKARRRLAQRARPSRPATTPAADPFGQPTAAARAR
jgi:hypothetical protein